MHYSRNEAFCQSLPQLLSKHPVRMHYLGIDISKDKFDVALLIDGKSNHKVFKNNFDGFERLNKWLETHLKTQQAFLIHSCMEATGKYGHDLAKYLFEQNHKVSIVNPACIKAFGRSQLQRIKTDKIDALLIAKFCAVNNPEAWNPPSKELEELTELTRRITHLEKLKTSENNHLKSVRSSKTAVESAKKILKSIDEEIDKLKIRISELIDLDDDLKGKKELLKTIPGIADRTAEVILSETKGMKDFENARQLAAYSGITPFQRQSGSSLSTKGMISRIGNSNLRTALFLPALVAKNHNPIIQAFCERLTERGKFGKQTICAAIRKLLHIVLEFSNQVNLLTQIIKIWLFPLDF